LTTEKLPIHTITLAIKNTNHVMPDLIRHTVFSLITPYAEMTNREMVNGHIRKPVVQQATCCHPDGDGVVVNCITPFLRGDVILILMRS
jgi:hypothetical protein